MLCLAPVIAPRTCAPHAACPTAARRCLACRCIARRCPARCLMLGPALGTRAQLPRARRCPARCAAAVRYPMLTHRCPQGEDLRGHQLPDVRPCADRGERAATVGRDRDGEASIELGPHVEGCMRQGCSLGCCPTYAPLPCALPCGHRLLPCPQLTLVFQPAYENIGLYSTPILLNIYIYVINTVHFCRPQHIYISGDPPDPGFQKIDYPGPCTQFTDTGPQLGPQVISRLQPVPQT
jgi:hypothetical protein